MLLCHVPPSPSQSTEELGGYQVLPCSKTPRVGRTTQKRPCVETPNENEDAEHTTLEMHKKEEETKRVTRTSSRKTLAEVNTNQPPLTAAEPQPAPEKKPARGGRRKKVVEDPVTVPTRRTTRAASRRAAAAAVKVVVLESDEEVAGSTESEAVPMEEVCVYNSNTIMYKHVTYCFTVSLAQSLMFT